MKYLPRHKQKIYTFADQALVSGGNFLTIAIALNYLTSVEFGNFAYGYSVYIIVSMFMSAFIFQPVSIMYPEMDEGNEYISRLRVLNLILMIGVGIVGCCLLYLFFLDTSSLIEILLLFFFIAFQQVSDFSRKISYVTHDASSAFRHSLQIYPVRLILLGLVTISSTAELYFLLLMSTLLNTGIELKSISKCKYDKYVMYTMFGQLYRNSRWLLANIPVAVLWGRSPVFLLGETVGIVQAGMFMAIRNLTNIANVPLEMLETKVSASLGRKVQANKESYLNTLMYVLLVGVVAWGVGLYILVNISEVVLEYYGAGKLIGSDDTMIVLWGANLLVFLFRLQSVHLRTTKNAVWIFYSYLFGVVFLVLNYFMLNIDDGMLRMSSSIVIASLVICLIQFIGIIVNKKYMVRHT